MQGDVLQQSITRLIADCVSMLTSERWRNEHRTDLAIPRPVCRNIQGTAHHGHHDLQIMRIAVIVRTDGRMRIGIGGSEKDFTLAVRQDDVGHQVDRL
jgi:hypothetical protein